jgi:hypothetical protein
VQEAMNRGENYINGADNIAHFSYHIGLQP